MTTKNLVIITDASGTIIAAQSEDFNSSKAIATIAPGEPDHKMHRITDVPEDITNLRDPNEFHRAITRHFHSESAKIKLTNREEYSKFLSSVLFSKSKKASTRK